MAVPLDKFFLVICIIALPNLYHRAEYNVPLMLFCYGLWTLPYRSLIIYLFIISWFIDAVRLMTDLSASRS